MPLELQSDIENKIICIYWGLMGGGGGDGWVEWLVVHR